MGFIPAAASAISGAFGIASGIAKFAGGAASYGENEYAAEKAREAAEDTKQAAILRNKQSKLEAQRQREMDIARVRETRSALVTSAASNGQLGGSAVQGALGSLNSQLTSNVGFGSEMQDIQDEILDYQNKAIDAGTEAGQAQQRAQDYADSSKVISGFGDIVTDIGKMKW